MIGLVGVVSELCAPLIRRRQPDKFHLNFFWVTHGFGMISAFEMITFSPPFFEVPIACVTGCGAFLLRCSLSPWLPARKHHLLGKLQSIPPVDDENSLRQLRKNLTIPPFSIAQGDQQQYERSIYHE